MSFIKSDSIVSSFKNCSYRNDLKPNESSSNIFRSIFENLEPRQKSIKIGSIFQVNADFYQESQGYSLMDKLITSSLKENPTHAYHYNWTVCKNSGVSEEEDNAQCSNQKYKKPTQNSQIKSKMSLIEQNEETQKYVDQKSDSVKKIKNQTKNIPKNYGKAIISFIDKNRLYIETITQHFDVDYEELLNELKMKKKSINTIADLRALWSNSRYAKCMRVISCIFLRKHALKYIFDSRICTYSSHIKYRQRLCEALSHPQDFMHIKDY